MSQKGWIKLHRSLIDHWVFNKKEKSWGEAWIDLLLMASHKDQKIIFSGQLISIKKGEILTSLYKLQTRWKRGRKWVNSLLRSLSEDQMISQKRNTRFTLITICNYSDFQGNDLNEVHTEVHTEVHSEVHYTRMKRMKRNIKKEKYKKEKKFSQNLKDLNFDSWPIQPNSEQKEIWHEVRRMKKLPINQSLVDRHGRRFQDCEKKGYKVRECMEMFLDNAWQSPELRYFESYPNLKMSKFISARRDEFRKAEPYDKKKLQMSKEAPKEMKKIKDILHGLKEKF